LRIADGRQGPLVKCWAGCDNTGILAAVGLTWRDVLGERAPANGGAPPRVGRPSRPRISRSIVATYDYADETGALLYQNVRCVTADGQKEFFHRRPDGHGGWLHSLGDVRRVIYRLDDLTALRPLTVLLVEGEKDTDRCWAHGFRATSSKNWTAEFSAQLLACGVRVVIVIPDNDESGRTQARAAAAACVEAGLAVQWLALPGLSDKEDISDWFDRRGGTAEQLRALIASAPGWPPVEPRVTLDDAHDAFCRWLGPEYDMHVLDVVLTAAASEQLAGDPVWALVVAGAGAGKTETVSALEGAGAIVVSMISSPGALLSGTSERTRARDATGGLLRRIMEPGQRGLLVIKDLTTILTMDKTTKMTVVGAFREIYDGKWSREIGTDGGRVLEWRGRIVVVGATTTEWDTAHEVLAACGDRFLLVRIDTTLGRRAAFRQARQNLGHEVEMRQELCTVVGRLLQTVDPNPDVVLTAEEEDDLYELSNVLTWARSSVRRDYRDDVISPHSPEQPPRVGKQLFQLIRSAVALGMSRRRAMNLAARCAHDSINPTRLALLQDLQDHPQTNIAKLARRVALPYMTAKRNLEALWTLGLASREEVRDSTAPQGEYEYSLTSRVNLAIFQKFDITTEQETASGSDDADITRNTYALPANSENVPF
jgi:predicted transcriptional regulator